MTPLSNTNYDQLRPLNKRPTYDLAVVARTPPPPPASRRRHRRLSSVPGWEMIDGVNAGRAETDCDSHRARRGCGAHFRSGVVGRTCVTGQDERRQCRWRRRSRRFLGNSVNNDCNNARSNNRNDTLALSVHDIWLTIDFCRPVARAVITIAIRLRYDYDTTTTKNWHVHFWFFCSRKKLATRMRRITSNGSRRARYVVVG